MVYIKIDEQEGYYISNEDYQKALESCNEKTNKMDKLLEKLKKESYHDSKKDQSR